MNYWRRYYLYFFYIFIFLSIAAAASFNEPTIIDLEFKNIPELASPIDRTLQSIQCIRKPGGLSLNGLYLMTHYGNRENLFRAENDELRRHPLIEKSWRYCSLFSSTNESYTMLGRNWDNENVGSIIVSLSRPPDGYASISFTRAIDMGFPINVDLLDFSQAELGRNLLLAPFYSYDGINEHGLAVGCAGVRHEPVTPRTGRSMVYVPYLVRLLLDHTRNIEEAVDLIEKHVPFDLDKHSLNSHFFVMDASGRSVILEYIDNEWKSFPNKKKWQVLTNKRIYNMTNEELKSKCERYRRISQYFENSKSNFIWKDGLKILKDASQRGTAWSVVYSTTGLEVFFSVYQKWDTVYHIKLPS